MTLYAFSIDLDRCIGCQACAVACKMGNELENGDTYIKVRDVVTGRMPNLFGSFAHHRCFHCADAACVHVCPTGCLSKAENGMTVVNADVCVGCGYCTNACPYIIPTIAPNRRVSKCVACAEPVSRGELPYCVQTCPSDAIKYGERSKILADAEARVASLKARYPNAQVYGKTQLGGLGLLMILLDKPEVYGLMERPRIPSPIAIWQRTHPLTIPAAGLAAVLTGFAFVIGRRNHAREQAEVHAALEREQAAPSPAPVAEAPVAAAPVTPAEVAAAVEPVPAPPAETEQAAEAVDTGDVTDAAAPEQAAEATPEQTADAGPAAPPAEAAAQPSAPEGPAEDTHAAPPAGESDEGHNAVGKEGA